MKDGFVVEGIQFTHREKDVLSCILHYRGNKKIAQFLSISPKTVEVHARNIMIKLKCNSREGIIDFVESSNKFDCIKKHYETLINETLFERQLEKLKTNENINSGSAYFFHNLEENADFKLLKKIQKHLKILGIKTLKSTKNNELIEQIPEVDYVFLALKHESKNDFINHTESVERALKVKLGNQKVTFMYFLITSEKNQSFSDTNLEKTVFSFSNDNVDYCKTFFALVEKINIGIDLESYKGVIKTFSPQHNTLSGAHSTYFKQNLKMNAFHTIFFETFEFLSRKKQYKFIVLIFILAVLIIFFANYFSSSSKLIYEDSPYVRMGFTLPNPTKLIERKALIEKIDSKFNNDKEIQTVVITGIGGVGKTTLARQYALYKGHKLIWEINTQNQASIIDSFDLLLSSFPLKPEELKKIAMIRQLQDLQQRALQLFKLVKKKLCAHSDWILIYDDVKSFSAIKNYFPFDVKIWGRGKIIITTQNGNIVNNSYIKARNTIRLDELSFKDKLTLFTQIVGPKNIDISKQSLRNFIASLPPFPLDISLAAYYIKNTSIHYSDYEKHLKNRTKEFEKIQVEILKEVSNYTKTRYKIISLSIQNVINLHPEFKNLLLLIGLLDPKNIQRDILNFHRDKVLIDSFMYHLKKYSLIETNDQSMNLLIMHQSTQNAMMKCLLKELQDKDKILLGTNVGNHFLAYLKDIARNKDYPRAKKAVYHQQQFEKFRDIFEFKLQAEIYTQFGKFFYYLGDNGQAEQNLKKSLYFYQTYFPQLLSKIVLVRMYLAKLYRNIGKYQEAKKMLEKNYEFYQKNRADYPIKYAWMLANLGNVYRSLGDFQKAKNYLEESVHIYKKHHDTNYVKVAWVSIHLGCVLRHLGNYKKAFELLSKGLTSFTENYGENHILTAWAEACLAKIYIYLEKESEALKLLEHSLKIHQLHYGKSHIQTAWVLRSFGRLYLRTGEFDKAKQNIRESAKILERERNTDRYLNYRLLSEIYEKEIELHVDLAQKTKKQKAIKYLSDAFEIAKVEFGEESPNTLKIRKKLDKLIQKFRFQNSNPSRYAHSQPLID